MNLKLLTALAASALAAAACASNGPQHGFGGPSGGGDRLTRRAPNLFISPAGKPFRAGPEEPYPSALWFAQADKDHDGRLTRAEFEADAEAFFRELDQNHDGVIDGFEVEHYEQVVAPEINPQVEGLRFGEGMDLSLGSGSEERAPRIGQGPRSGGRELAGDRRPEGAGVYGLLNEPEPVAAADTQFNSRITPEEFRAAADRRFAVLDSKGLGYLTLETLPKTPVQRLLERQKARRARELQHPGSHP